MMRSWKFCSFKLLRYSGRRSGILGSVLAFWEMQLVSGKCLDPFVFRGCCRSLGSISWFWKVFWTLGLFRYSWNLGVCVFSFWQVFCYLPEVFKCFSDSRKCFVPSGHFTTWGKTSVDTLILLCIKFKFKKSAPLIKISTANSRTNLTAVNNKLFEYPIYLATSLW